MENKIDILTSEHIKDIKKSIGEFPKEGPITYSYKLSEKFLSNIFIKSRWLQNLDAYSIRALYYKISKINKREFIIIGDEALLHELMWIKTSTHLDFTPILIMPDNGGNYPHTKDIKIIKHGKNLEETKKEALNIVKTRNLPYINTYEDPDIISTYGTVALEFLRDEKSLEIIIVPITHGTLISGISIFIKEILPQIKIIGVYRENRLFLNRKTSSIIKKYVDTIYPVGKSTIRDIQKIYKEELENEFFAKDLLPIAFLFEEKIITKNKSIGLIL